MTGYTASDFANGTGVSRETLAKYEQWNNLLVKWNNKINLVAPGTLDQFWHRHALDSHQLISLLPESVKTVLDMGAGAGFPGIAVAIETQGSSRHVTLCETNGKKANFLRAVIRELGLPASVAQTRIENLPIPDVPFDVITARAFAALPDLLGHSHRLWGANTIGLFPKGEQWQAEIEAAKTHYKFDFETFDSRTTDGAKIIQISNLHLL